MVRHDLSQPVALLVRHGLMRPGVSLFDYGCGQGDDLRILTATGLTASGWDPHFRPDDARTPADVVNLGFVLNVIEAPLERRDALTGAWRLTQKVLAVSTMIVGQVAVSGLRSHGDGYLTARGTFQKYFEHAELRAFIAQTLDSNPVAIAPGIFFVFRTPEDEQDFLLNRRSGRRLSTATYRIRREGVSRRATRAPLLERLPLALEAISGAILRHGRTPTADELSPDVLTELAEQKVSLTRATELCLDDRLAPADVIAAAAARREDLLVHQALGLLNRSASASRPSAAMVRDIRAHIGSQKEMATQVMDYLRGLADQERVHAALQRAAADGLGLLDARGRLVVDGDRAEDLPGLLRCYFGCATVLSGEPEGRYILRIDADRRQVTMWPLLDADGPLPRTETALRVDLKRQGVHLRPDARTLLRKGELAGESPRTKQRRLEMAYRQDHNLPPEAIFERPSR